MWHFLIFCTITKLFVKDIIYGSGNVISVNLFVSYLQIDQIENNLPFSIEISRLVFKNH